MYNGLPYTIEELNEYSKKVIVSDNFSPELYLDLCFRYYEELYYNKYAVRYEALVYCFFNFLKFYHSGGLEHISDETKEELKQVLKYLALKIEKFDEDLQLYITNFLFSI